MPKTSHPNSFARKTAVVPLPHATSRTRLAELRPSMRPSCPVNCKPPGWNESPRRNRVRSLSYSLAQHCLTCSCSERTRVVSSFVAMNHRCESMPTRPSRGFSACLNVNSMGRGSNLRPSDLALLRSGSSASSCVLACSRYPMVLYAQNGTCLPPGSRNSLQHFIKFFWLKVHGSMKSCNMIMTMFFAISPMVRFSGSPHAWQEMANCSADFCDPETDEDDHRHNKMFR